MTAVLTDLAGWVGAGCLLLAYMLLSMGRIRAGRAFQLLNFAGSLGLAVNGVAHQAWPSVALNLVWVAVGLATLRSRAGTQPNRNEPA
jgi:hypothetical protein